MNYQPLKLQITSTLRYAMLQFFINDSEITTTMVMNPDAGAKLAKALHDGLQAPDISSFDFHVENKKEGTIWVFTL
jgi:hypothetical protein